MLFAPAPCVGAKSVSSPSDTLRASLITCYPGPEIYELYGHEAIRIRGAELDSVWNYGLFDFTEPGFVYRFVKGETDYMVGGYPFSWFLPMYVARGSKVVEQDLNLTREETARLRRLLQVNSLPANRTYRYNYIKDNCATRITAMLDSASGRRIIYRDTLRHASFRDEMRHYNEGYPWYQFGIDLALGSGLDHPVDVRSQMFVPVEMMRTSALAQFDDGTPLLGATRIIHDASERAVQPPTPWYLTPLAAAVIVLLISVAVAVYDIRRRLTARWWYSLYYGAAGLAGCLIAFLVAVSEHEATSPNILILWLNPLQLLIAALIWWRRARVGVLIMACYNIVVVGSMAVIWAWQSQSGNVAFIPLVAADLVLSAAYAINYTRVSYNKSGSARRKMPRASAGRASGGRAQTGRRNNASSSRRQKNTRK